MPPKEINTGLAFRTPERRGAAGSEGRVRDIKPAKIDSLSSTLDSFAAEATRRIQTEAAQFGAARGQEEAAEAIAQFRTTLAKNAPTITGEEGGEVGVDMAAFADPAPVLKSLLKNENKLIRRSGQLAYNAALRKQFKDASISAFMNRASQIQDEELNRPGGGGPDQAIVRIESALVGHLDALTKADSTGILTNAVGEQLSENVNILRQNIVAERQKREMQFAQADRKLRLDEWTRNNMGMLLSSQQPWDVYLNKVEQLALSVAENGQLSAGEAAESRATFEAKRDELLAAQYAGIFQQRYLDIIESMPPGDGKEALIDEALDMANDLWNEMHIPPEITGADPDDPNALFFNRESGRALAKEFISRLNKNRTKQTGMNLNFSDQKDVVVANIFEGNTHVKVHGIAEMLRGVDRGQLPDRSNLDAINAVHEGLRYAAEGNPQKLADAELWHDAAVLAEQTRQRVVGASSRVELMRHLDVLKEHGASEGIDPSLREEIETYVETTLAHIDRNDEDGTRTNLYCDLNPAECSAAGIIDLALAAEDPLAETNARVATVIADSIAYAKKIYGPNIDRNLVPEGLMRSFGRELQTLRGKSPKLHRQLALGLIDAIDATDSLSLDRVLRTIDSELLGDPLSIALRGAELVGRGSSALSQVAFNHIMNAAEVDVSALKKAFDDDLQTAGASAGDKGKNIFRRRGIVRRDPKAAAKAAALVGVTGADSNEAKVVALELEQAIYLGNLHAQMQARRTPREGRGEVMTATDWNNAAKAAEQATQRWFQSLPDPTPVRITSERAEADTQTVNMYMPRALASRKPIVKEIGKAFTPEKIQGGKTQQAAKIPATELIAQARFEFDEGKVSMTWKGFPVVTSEGTAIEYKIPADVLEEVRQDPTQQWRDPNLVQRGRPRQPLPSARQAPEGGKKGRVRKKPIKTKVERIEDPTAERLDE